MGYKLQNVLDQLKDIAENNDSEDVAAAIKTADAYSFKDRLAEMEKTNEEQLDEFLPALAAAAAGTVIGNVLSGDDDEVSESPGDDDQYCALCGNTGYRLDTKGEPCPNCDEGEGEAKANEDAEISTMSANAGIPETCGADHDAADAAFDRIADRVDARHGDEGGDDMGFDADTDDGSEDMGADAAANDPWGIGDGDEAVEEAPKDGSAVERVQQRAERSGTGGPIERVQGRHEERFAEIDEQIGMIFQTPAERHSWMMNQLNGMTQNMTSEDSAMISRLLKTAGEADVKGGNC